MSYLTNLLDQYAVSAEVEEIFRGERERIQTALSNNWRTGNPRFYYGGSFIKRTMISEAYDLDIIVYFPPTDAFAVRQIYEAVEQRLQGHRFATRRHNVAIRLPYKHFHIDVVPGRAMDNSYRYANLYASERDTTKQTSLKVHIDLVRNGEAQDVVKILKLWRHRHTIPIRSLVLELATVQALFNNRQITLEDRVWKVLGWLRDSFATARLVDPANSNNIVTDDISLSDKARITAAANQSRLQRSWKDVVW
jgi:hypothetical protein